MTIWRNFKNIYEKITKPNKIRPVDAAAEK